MFCSFCSFDPNSVPNSVKSDIRRRQWTVTTRRSQKSQIRRGRTRSEFSLFSLDTSGRIHNLTRIISLYCTTSSWATWLWLRWLRWQSSYCYSIFFSIVSIKLKYDKRAEFWNMLKWFWENDISSDARLIWECWVKVIIQMVKNFRIIHFSIQTAINRKRKTTPDTST